MQQGHRPLVPASMRRGLVLTVALTLSSAWPVQAHPNPGRMEVFVWPGTCGAKSHVKASWWLLAGERLKPPLKAPILQVTHNDGHWYNVGSFSMKEQTTRFNLKKIRDRQRTLNPSTWTMDRRGYEVWYMRAKIPGLRYHSDATQLIVDDSPPSVSIISPDGANAHIEDDPILEYPLAVVRGKTTLEADAFDPGVGFGQSRIYPMWNWDSSPAIVWTLLNETTGQTTEIESHADGDNRILDRQVFDFSAAPGVYRITATAIDCVGNTSSDTVRVLGT